MLLNPRWWIGRYFKGAVDENHIALEWALRILSMPLIGAGIYFLMQFTSIR